MEEINENMIVTDGPRAAVGVEKPHRVKDEDWVAPGSDFEMRMRGLAPYKWTQLDRSQHLSDAEVHVWSASLELSSPEIDELLLLLSPDEKKRASRFYFARDRGHFIAGRGLLRTLLGSYLEMEPSQIEFVYNKFGKPALATKVQSKTLDFNLSHSEGLVLYIFGWDRRVGIDVEYMKSMADMDDFVKHCFSDEETKLINSLSGNAKMEAFFKTWTGKEAYLKARGTGLTVPTNQVRIPLGINEDFTLNTSGRDKEQPIAWQLELFRPLPLYQAALVVEGRDARIVFQK